MGHLWGWETSRSRSLYRVDWYDVGHVTSEGPFLNQKRKQPLVWNGHYLEQCCVKAQTYSKRSTLSDSRRPTSTLVTSQLATIGSFGACDQRRLMQVSVGRGTLKCVRLREIYHKNDVNERQETLATSSMERALFRTLLRNRLKNVSSNIHEGES